MQALLTISRRYAIWALLLALPMAALAGSAGLTLPAAAVAEARELTIGASAQGRPITAVQFGDGPRKLVVVGNTHGGPESNTHALVLQLIEHFRANPQEVPPAVRLYLIPTLNPDGLALDTRFDAAGVDLNRNMNTNLDACPENDWRVTVFGAGGFISDTGGPFPDSQAESRVIRSFLLDAAGAIFLHSNAGLVFPAFCDHPPSLAMGQAYAEGAGYLYSRFWPRYMITGGMHDWAGSLGIAAITPELITGDLPELAENLAGLRAVLGRAEELLPLPADQIVDGVTVPAVIWRYWRALGGEAVFGRPLAPAEPTRDGLAQTFSRARIELRPALADTAELVRVAPLGLGAYQALAFGGAAATAPVSGAGAPRYFMDTGHTLKEAFLVFWERNGGEAVFGMPLSEEFDAVAADGQVRTMQYFQGAVFAYHPEDGSVQPEPLGAIDLQRAAAVAPWAAQQIR